MDEKIQLLAHELPGFLVQNRQVYAILSKGNHVLSEDECLQYFDIVKAAIALVVNAEREAREKVRKQTEAATSIQALHG